ncbi:MAG: 2-oxoacid:acceptor oxidoreductase family protein [Planctomycetes bacterium]|nr:2-oxoacid:acceptor oxidoreductase family protein [Planctomycetota bacterium]
MAAALIPTVTLALVGDAGEGVLAAGEWLLHTAGRLSLDGLGERRGPLSFAGGVASFWMRLGASLPPSSGSQLDLLVEMDGVADDPGLVALRERLRRGALRIVDSESAPEREGTEPICEIARAPMRRLARDAHGTTRACPWVAAGVAAGILGLPGEAVERLMAEAASSALGAERERQALLRSVRAGMRYAVDELSAKRIRTAFAVRERAAEVASVPQTLARALWASGVRVATAVGETATQPWIAALEATRPQGAEATFQILEDANAAAAAAVGASFGGAISCAVLSSGALARAGECIAAAATAEIPFVIVAAQRGAPLGAPDSAWEQGDLWGCAAGGPGRTARAVLSVTDAGSVAFQAAEAVRIAQTYQMPCVLLVDAVLAGSVATTPRGVASGIEPLRRRPSIDAPERFQRYAPAPAGISTMPMPGEPGFEFAATVREHDASGAPAPMGAAREAGIRKRQRKVDALRQELDMKLSWIGLAGEVELEDYEVVVIGFGSTRGALLEGAALAAREGIRALALPLVAIAPLPRRVLERVRDRFEESQILVFDGNASGDLAGWLRVEAGLRGKSIRRFDGTPFRPADVLAQVREVFAR